MSKHSRRSKRARVRKTRSLFNKKSFITIFFSVTALALLWSFVVYPIYRRTNAGYGKILRPISSHKSKPVCGSPSARAARCAARVVTNGTLQPLASSTPPITAVNPAQLHNAYNLPCTPGGPVQSACPAPTSFGPIVAIVDAYHTPTLENDLNVFSRQYDLPPCTQANGCLQIVDQNGGTSLPTGIDQSWSLEASLDVQTVHAICQTCKILLVETNTNMYSDLTAGVNTAARLGAVAISNSYGSVEFSTQTAFDAYFNHPGVAVVASSGDSGYGAGYPASSPYVISVGGTTLRMYTDNTYAGESVWTGAGSGCSAYESALSAQTAVSGWAQTGCANKRGNTDIAAVADPNTGVAVYNTTPYNGQTGWWQVGGTSLSAPIIAASFALANNTGLAGTQISAYLYQQYNAANYHDVATGSNGSCTTTMCKGVAGYDGPTGLGTLLGLGGFGGAMAPTIEPPTPTQVPVASPTIEPPTPTRIPTITPFPTSTPVPTFSITGKAYLDMNRNGIRDAGESGLAQQVVSLDPPAKPGLWTDGSGNYAFNDIHAGTYKITLVLAPTSGYFATTPNPATLTVGPSGVVDFGVYPPQPPYISNVKASNITTSSVTITYTTAAPGTSGIIYGLRKTSINVSGPYDSNMVTSHRLTVTGLAKNTTYYYKVYSQGGPYMQYSAILSFKTAVR